MKCPKRHRIGSATIEKQLPSDIGSQEKEGIRC
nr:MAG TPA: hypothetical protein [Caudoviricetes sp.]